MKRISLLTGLLVCGAAFAVAACHAADAPAAEAPVAEAPAIAGPTAGPATQKWDATFDAWKNLLGEMRELRGRYDAAEEDEIPGLRKEYRDLVAKGREFLERLRTDGMAAFQEAPLEDRELTRFLVKMASDDAKHDRFERVTELTSVLIENGSEDGAVFNAAGTAAFAMNDFEKAKEYLTKAEEAGELADNGAKFLPVVDDYIKFWATEQKVRQAEAEADDLPRVKMTTNKGELVIELFENEAPQTIGNFVSLVEQGFYDGLTFHRVLPGFMAQGGCPKGDGTGDPGYSIYGECDGDDTRMHFRGSLSMAHSGSPNSGGSQFFLTFVPTPWLNKQHTVFGRVVEGLDVLEQIQRRDPESASPSEPDKIIKAEVLRKRPDHKYVPSKVQ